MSSTLILLTGFMLAVIFAKTRGEGEIRLVNGNDGLEGRVEIFQDGKWGTVCDDNWSIKNAHVVCQQLGLGHATSAYGKGYFRSGTGPISMDEVDCVGDEERLDQCPFRGWFSHNCVHQEDAGVRCSTGDGGMRLVNGITPYEGRVEFFHGGNWGTICDEGWDINNAKVVCRKLGLGFAEKAVTGGYYGQGKGEILLSNVICEGTENGLDECSHPGYLRHTCGHNQDAGVRCRASENLDEELCMNFDVRLVEYPAESKSQVEVCYKGIWGTVCGNSWGEEEAFVVCRQLGFVTFYSFETTNNTSNHIVENLTCEENQSLLLNCDISFGNPKCTSTAALSCSGKSSEVINTNCTSGTLRLVDGDAYYNGRVEICDSGIWVDLYVASWGFKENHEICTLLGYHGATDFVLTQPLPDFKEAGITSISCPKHATTLLECSFTSNDGNSPAFELKVACVPAFGGGDIFWIFCMFLSASATAVHVFFGVILVVVFCAGCAYGCFKKARQRISRR